MADADIKKIKAVTFGAVKTNEDVELAAYGMMKILFPELVFTDEDLKRYEERLRIAREKDRAGEV